MNGTMPASPTASASLPRTGRSSSASPTVLSDIAASVGEGAA